MDYKRIFKNPEIRHKVLNTLNFVPDACMLRMQYFIKTGRNLNLKNPQRFTEKLQWYKLNYRNPIMRQCVDKFTVRNYIKSKGLSDILYDCYGVYSSVDSINFQKLPNSFVIKKTNGGGGLNVLICRDKNNFDIAYAKETMRCWLNSAELSGGREWAYKGLTPMLIIEEYLENKEEPDAGINDYKFFCFSGKPMYIVVDVDRYIEHKRNFYDVKWNNLHITSDCSTSNNEIKKPDNLNEMLDIAQKLSNDFPFVRVDLYNIDGKIYFGELTFYPWSGYVEFTPDSFDFDLGNKFNLV